MPTPSLPISTTISHRQLDQLQLNTTSALEQALSMGFCHLRLPTYWSEVESEPNHYDFSLIKSWLKKCEVSHQPVVLTLGLKAPRWPEFYWPNYIQNRLADEAENHSRILSLIAETVTQLGEFSCISHWQVENEPLNPSGPTQDTIPFELLAHEVQLVRELDERPVLTTTWANNLKSAQLLEQLSSISDVVGIDLYYHQYLHRLLGRSLYTGPETSDQKLRQMITDLAKPVWITELQAEPWEKDEAGYRSSTPASCSPEKMSQNVAQASELGVQEIFLWGYEYWLFRAAQNDHRYLQQLQTLLSSSLQ